MRLSGSGTSVSDRAVATLLTTLRAGPLACNGSWDSLRTKVVARLLPHSPVLTRETTPVESLDRDCVMVVLEHLFAGTTDA